MGGYCEAPECFRRAFSKGLCEVHFKQVQRGRRPSPHRPRLTSRDAMVEAMIAIVEADTESETEYRYAWERFLYHGARFFQGRCSTCQGGQGCPVEEGD